MIFVTTKATHFGKALTI